MMISGGKLRVIGFECIQNESERHTFYMCSTTQIAKFSPEMTVSSEDDEGFVQPKEGILTLPFSMFLPLEGEVGNSKGVFTQGGVAVRYIIML
jgi:hypothetical protein